MHRILAAAALLCALLGHPAFAQHNHDRHHDDYKSWASEVTSNCCNNQDCGVLREDDVRDTATGTQVKIEGQWCPVERKHYLTRGKSPDWNASHACVGNSSYWKEKPPCERLLCFTGRGGV